MQRRNTVVGRLVITLLFLVTLNWVTAQDPAATPEVGATQPVVSTSAPLSPTPTLVPTTTSTSEIVYTVQPGETLFRIAVRFHTTVQQLAQANKIANPALIYAGQQIHIPGIAATPTPIPAPTQIPSATPVPVATTSYTVQRGDILFRVAIRFHTTIATLIKLNNLADPNVIYVGQVLKVPAETGTSTSTTASSSPTAQGSSAAQIGPVAGYGFSYGIEAFLLNQDVAGLISQISSLGVKWVKQTVNWRDFEATKGQIDFSSLDPVVNALHGAGLNILFTVTAAPDWARSTNDESGPPDNFADYGTFITALVQHYTGQVQAYEIWDEPNLRREWNSKVHPLGATSYVQLLNVAYSAVKAADPKALVISAGLAPTGFNDNINAVDDRQFLKDAYASGLAAISDAIGAHPLGWANPPDSSCCVAPVGVQSHYESRTFYFRNTLDDYRQIMVANKDSSTPIWITKFGWGTSEDTQSPSSTNIYVSYTSLGEQAIYDPRAFELAVEFGYIGPMFLDNLNGCQVGSDEDCYYALIGPDGSPRPVFAAVQNEIASPGSAVQPNTAETTPEGAVEPTVEPPTAEPTIEQQSQPTPEITTSP